MSGDKFEQLGSRIGLVESIPKGALWQRECLDYFTLDLPSLRPDDFPDFLIFWETLPGLKMP